MCLCPECESKTITIREGSSISFKCPKCGWAVAATYIDLIHEDETVYSVVLRMTDEITKEKLKVVSRVIGCNFIKAKSLLMQDGVVLIEDKSIKIKEVAVLLKECKI